MSALSSVCNKIIELAEVIEGFALRPYQRTALKRAAVSLITGQGQTLTNVWARKSGKSETIKALILSLMPLLPSMARLPELQDFPHLQVFGNGFQVAIAGPKMSTASLTFKRIRRQAKTKRFKEILKSLGIDVVASNSVEFELSNGSLAQAFSGSETANAEGPDAHLLYLDEAQLLSPFSVYKILRPFVASTNGLVVETGTPGRSKCPFLSDIEFNMRKIPDAHLCIPYTEVMKVSPNYKSYIQSELERLPGGQENIYFRMNYMLEWILSTGHFIDSNHLLSLATAPRGIDRHFDEIYGGIDWGKASSATTVTIEGRWSENFRIIDLLRLKGSYDQQFKALIPFLEKYFTKGMLKVRAETNNVGDPNTEKLQLHFGKAKIEGFYTSPGSKDRIYTVLQNDMQSTRFTYFQDNSPEALTWEREFMDLEQEVKGNLLCVHKPDVEGSSDDFCDSTALAHSLFPPRNLGMASRSRSSGHKRRSIASTSDY